MKKQILGIIAVVVIIIAVAIFATVSKSEKQKITDSYTSLETDDHVFDLITLDEMEEIMLTEDMIVYFGSPECPACVSLVPEIDRLAKANDVETVYYVYLYYGSDLAGEWLDSGLYDYAGTPLMVLFEDGEFSYSNFSYRNTESEYYNEDGSFYQEIVRMFES